MSTAGFSLAACELSVPERADGMDQTEMNIGHSLLTEDIPEESLHGCS